MQCMTDARHGRRAIVSGVRQVFGGAPRGPSDLRAQTKSLHPAVSSARTLHSASHLGGDVSARKSALLDLLDFGTWFPPHGHELCHARSASACGYRMRSEGHHLCAPSSSIAWSEFGDSLKSRDAAHVAHGLCVGNASGNLLEVMCRPPTHRYEAGSYSGACFGWSTVASC